MEVKITQDIIDCIKCHRSKFKMPMPELGEVWKVDRVVRYPVACNGEPVVEMSRGKYSMRLPASLVFTKDDLRRLLQENRQPTLYETVHKLKHKPTGLWYKPGKKNLSKTGKIYPNKNTALSYLHQNRSTTIIDNQGKPLRVTKEDFELVPFRLELVELN